MENPIDVLVANECHSHFAETICKMLEESAAVRGTGIGKRNPEQIREKIKKGDAIIALCGNQLAGFCYVQTWQNEDFASHSALIVSPDFRSHGLAKKIKSLAFDLVHRKYPNAKIFGITTSLAVMKINTELGYKPVTFSELPQDEAFWAQCQGCKNHDILQRTERKMCLCTGMMALSAAEMRFDLTNKIIQNHTKNEQKYEEKSHIGIQRRLRHLLLHQVPDSRARA